MPDENPSVIVTPQGRPAREALKKNPNCPQCGAGPEKRVPSSRFGQDRHDCCCQCGYEFQEFTCG